MLIPIFLLTLSHVDHYAHTSRCRKRSGDKQKKNFNKQKIIISKNIYIMKKLFTLMAVVAALFVATQAQAQVQFGIKAGLNVDQVSIKDYEKTLDKNNRTGFFVGVTADVTIPLAGLGADISLLYDNKVIGVTEEKTNTEYNKTLHYVAIPINVKYTFGFSSLASVYLATGPQFSYNVGDRDWSLSGIDKNWELKKSEFSWNVGAGATVLKHVRIGYNYNIGIGNTAEVSVISTATSAVKGKLKNNTHQISLTYLF